VLADSNRRGVGAEIRNVVSSRPRASFHLAMSQVAVFVLYEDALLTEEGVEDLWRDLFTWFLRS